MVLEEKVAQELLIEEPTVVLDKGVLLGSIEAAVKADSLENLDFVLNMTPGLPSPYPDLLTYKRFPIKDVPSQPLRDLFPQTNAFIYDAVHVHKKGVLVHCAAGVSRSAAVILAYLMRHEGMTLREAFLFLRQKRPIVAPNDGFWKELGMYEEELHGKQTLTTEEYHQLLSMDPKEAIQPSPVILDVPATLV